VVRPQFFGFIIPFLALAHSVRAVIERLYCMGRRSSTADPLLRILDMLYCTAGDILTLANATTNFILYLWKIGGFYPGRAGGENVAPDFKLPLATVMMMHWLP
jgi:hypothetical protein